MNKTIQYALDLSVFLFPQHSYQITDTIFCIGFWPNSPKSTMIPSFQRTFYFLIAILTILSLALFVCVHLFVSFFSIQLFSVLFFLFGGFTWHNKHIHINKNVPIQWSTSWHHNDIFDILRVGCNSVQMKMSDVVHVRKHLIRVKFISHSEWNELMQVVHLSKHLMSGGVVILLKTHDPPFIGRQWLCWLYDSRLPQFFHSIFWSRCHYVDVSKCVYCLGWLG